MISKSECLGGLKKYHNKIKDSLSSAYSLPTANATQKGGVIIGDGLAMDGDTLNVTISGGASYAEATSVASGLMSASDKIKLDEIENYSLPTASGSVKGGVIVGEGLAMNGDTLNVTLSTSLVLDTVSSTVEGAMWIEV